jgi:hypothetical protein
MEPITQLTPSGEVAVFLDDDQFGFDQSVMKCGYEAVSIFWHSVKPGESNPYTSAEVHAMAHDDYVQLVGPDVPSDSGGMSNDQLYADLDKHQLHYRQIPQDFAWINGYLRYGYAVIIGVTEDSVFDLELGGKPYTWDTSGFTHVILCTGIGKSQTSIKVRDTANIGPDGVRQGPREYDTNKLRLVSATMVVPSWLPVPPNDFDPRSAPEVAPIDLNNPVVAGFFSATPDGKWQCKQTGNILQFGMLNFYRSYGKNAFCGLTYLGLPKSNEIPIAGHPGVVKQEFERGWLVYDPKHEVDNPPGSGEIYLMHLPN